MPSGGETPDMVPGEYWSEDPECRPEFCEYRPDKTSLKGVDMIKDILILEGGQ